MKKKKKLKIIWQIHILLQRRFWYVSSVHFQDLMIKKDTSITTGDSGNVQSHDQEEGKLNSSINANSGAHTLTNDKIIKSPFNKNNVATIKSK